MPPPILFFKSAPDNCIRHDRNTHGGGVALYISDKFDFLVVKSGPQDLEFLLVSVFIANNANKRLHIGLWYRPPSDSSSIDILYSVLETLEPSVFF